MIKYSFRTLEGERAEPAQDSQGDFYSVAEVDAVVLDYEDTISELRGEVAKLELIINDLTDQFYGLY